MPAFAATVTLSWNAPTTNSDTTQLTDLAGYRVYMSNTSGQYNSGNIVKSNIPASSSTGGVTETTTVDNLPNGTYYFIVTAYDIYGNESSRSNEILKTTTSSGNGNNNSNSSANSSGGDTISGGGCGFVKDSSDKSGSSAGQIALLFLLPLILIKIRQLLKLQMDFSPIRKIYSLFILTFTILTFYPINSYGAVNLPWSTTYNCPEWTQSNGLYNVNCDGLTGDVGWTTSDGKEGQITSAANYPGGGGVRGQRQWVGDGANNNSGGIKITFNSPQPELWIRWYMRYELGFQWGTLVYDKILYLDPGPIHAVIPEFYGFDKMSIAKNKSPQHQASPNGTGWNAIMANGGTDANGNKKSDGQWHLYEIHIKMDTNGADGIAEFWIDNVRILYYNNSDYGTVQGWSSVLFGSNQRDPANGRDMYVDFDDIVISTAGPIGGSMPDKISPSAASGLN